MSRVFSRFPVGLMALSILAPGCGQDLLGPPSRPKSGRSTDPTPSSQVTYLVMVTPGFPSDEVVGLGLRAQRDANLRRAIFRIMGPTPDQGSAGQPDVIRKAVADGASALIVVPGGSPELGPALVEAEAKGVPVVLLARTIPAPPGSKPFTVVEHADFDDSARKIVAATLEDGAKAGRSAEGTALVVVDRVTDSSSDRRVAALKAAAGASGFRKLTTVPFDGSKEGAAKLAVLEAVKADPEVSVVLGDDSEATMGASDARVTLAGKPAVFVGGYMDFGAAKNYMIPQRDSCYVEGNFAELGSLAVKTAIEKLEGKAVEGRVVLSPKFTRGPGLVASEAGLLKKRSITEGAPNLGRAYFQPEPEVPSPKP